LYPWLTVLDNVELGLDALRCKRRRENPSLKRPGSPVAPE
jgi:ABC-type nitrate/sulfonate/bicarbonate transport system ATPase subunit